MLYSVHNLHDFTVKASNGDIGLVQDLVIEEGSWVARYLVVTAGGWLSGRKVFLSPMVIKEVGWDDRILNTRLSCEQIEQSADLSSVMPLSLQDETHYLAQQRLQPYWGGGHLWGEADVPTPLTAALSSQSEKRVGNMLDARPRGELHPFSSLSGCRIEALDGEGGELEDMLFNRIDWQIKHVIVDPRSWWPGPHVLIAPQAIQTIQHDGRLVTVAMTNEAIKLSREYAPGAEMHDHNFV